MGATEGGEGGLWGYLGCHAVLLHERLLGEVDHEGIIRAQTHIHAPSKEGREGVAVVVQEQAVVGQRAHAQSYLDGTSTSSHVRSHMH